MYIDLVLALALFAAIAVLAAKRWESGGDDHEPPTLDTRNHLDE